MDLRSNYVLGKDVFVKLISLDEETVEKLETSLKKGEEYAPFSTVEFLMTYLISKEKPDLISPRSKVLYSDRELSIEFFSDKSYNEVVKEFPEYSPLKNVKTVIIVSEKLEGNLEKYITSVPDRQDLENALIHISWLYFEYQKLFFATHGDPKPANYTWRKLDTPIDITYDFRDSFDNSEKRLIVRKGVKNLFYLTDLEFAHSSFIIKRENKYFNFTKIYDFIDDGRKDIILVPKLSSDPYYDYNVNLYGGYYQKILKKEGDISERFGVFPRMFSIDLLVLIKTFLTYDYSQYFPAYILRKLNLYFTRFIALSQDNRDYIKASPAALAFLISE